MKIFVLLLLFIVSCYVEQTDAAALQCKKDDGTDISWVIYYQIPSTQTAQAIYAGTDPGWEATPLDLTKAAGSIGSLLTPFFTQATKEDYNIIAFSNYPPLFRRCVECGSNTRGVLGWTDDNGWFLFHTVDKWPDFSKTTFAAPPAGKANLIVCITAPVTTYGSLGTALEYQDPMIYYYISATKAQAKNTLESIPSLKALTEGSTHVYSPFTMNYKFTVGGTTQTPVYIISKLSRAYQDVYSSYMTMLLKQNLLVWSNPGSKPLLPSYCSGPYKVENVKPKSITVKDTLVSRRQDTSNWVASKAPSASAVFCVSITPRTQAATSIASGVLCMEHQKVQTLFSTIAITAGIDECK
ncbi:Deoxyribonuclease (DNase) II [Trichuris trichiura]|uniref:Deoxyribonuclease (DNase) II n=1 Tax=Trichuris trichiura TaxID=36087 RepID=A0A077ZAI1_TRITR|nr:Deoxyribonuclease (DNase) II [Trichuris trichiura]